MQKKKKNLNSIILENHIKNILISIILLTFVIIIAIIFDKLLEFITFFVTYTLIKNEFTKAVHGSDFTTSGKKAIIYCIIITTSIQIISLIFLIKIDFSKYANILLAFVLGVINYYAKDYLEKVIVNKSILNDKDKLLLACKNANLTKSATNRLVLKYVDGMKIKEIAEIENVEEITILQSIRRSRRKLNI